MTPAGAPIARPRQTLPALTGARFVAAILVVLFHTVLPRLSGDGIIVRLLSGGYLGVSFFFVLSGFILAYTYLYAGNTLGDSAIPFWRARFARVYPVYVLALLVAAPLFLKQWIIDAWQTQRLSGGLLAGVLSPLLLQAWWPTSACAWNCPGWSLSVETLFYAVFPMLGLWLAARRRERIVAMGLAIWLVSLAWPAAYLLLRPDGLSVVGRGSEQFWITLLRYNPLVHLGEFTLGITVGLHFLARTATAARTSDSRVSSWSAALPVGAVLALVATVLAAGDRVPYALLHSGLLAPLFAALIYALARGGGVLGTMLGARPVVKLGEASYALYLLHLPIAAFFVFAETRLGLSRTAGWMLTVAAIATSVVVSLVVFEVVEEPCRRFLRAAPRRGFSSNESVTRVARR